jgi:hypothetical protein
MFYNKYDNIDKIVDASNITGLVLAGGQYLVGDKISEGQQGQVYQVQDSQNASVGFKNLVVKFSTQLENMDKEIFAMSKVGQC